MTDYDLAFCYFAVIVLCLAEIIGKELEDE